MHLFNLAINPILFRPGRYRLARTSQVWPGLVHSIAAYSSHLSKAEAMYLLNVSMLIRDM